MTGLRARKRERLRREISDVATRLFVAHGFEQVTLAQIADAADVSVKTIFNHFGSKEDLFFDRVDEFKAGFVATIVERPPGQTVLGALRGLMLDGVVPMGGFGWTQLGDADRYALFRGFQVAQDRSPALRARRAILADDVAADLTGALARELGRTVDDATIRVLVAMIVATNGVRDRTLRAAVIAELPPDEVRRRVTAVVEAAFDRLERAFGDLDRPR